jgi:hypothetical protein
LQKLVDNMDRYSQPPQLVERLLRWTLPEALKEPILGDLAEEFQQKRYQNTVNARRWYIRQALTTSNHYIWQTKRGLVMFSLSIVVFTALSIMALWFSSGDLSMFLDVPSLLLIFPPSILFALGVTSVNDMKNGFASLFDDEINLSKLELVRAKQFFDVMGNSAMFMGAFTTFIGAIAIGSNLAAEDFSTAFGPAFAVCILVLMYSSGFKTVCYVASQKIQYKLHAAD